MTGLNLHALARDLIQSVHPEEKVTLYQSVGQINVKGVITPKYAPGQTVLAQVQSVGDAKLYHTDRVGQNDITRHFYLFANPALPPAGIVRPLARGGDIIRRASGSLCASDCTWWQVVSVPEDFSAGSGWVLVLASLQTIAPDFSASDWFAPELAP